jgi:hypothetical protein
MGMERGARSKEQEDSWGRTKLRLSYEIPGKAKRFRKKGLSLQ